MLANPSEHGVASLLNASLNFGKVHIDKNKNFEKVHKISDDIQKDRFVWGNWNDFCMIISKLNLLQK